jgi:putative ABC transport system ATP-binding protein
MPLVVLEKVTKTYVKGSETIRALDGVDLSIEPGDFLSIMGPSGSGKSTLLNVLGLLDRPATGVYRHGGTDVMSLDDDALSSLRNRTVGFIFQSFNLFPEMTALENIETPLLYAGVPAAERRRRAEEKADLAGIRHRLAHRPAELSGGEMQRVAIARALAGDPALLLADEPTGNLDEATSRLIVEMLRDLNRRGMTLVVVTHNPEIGSLASRQIRIRDGRFVA